MCTRLTAHSSDDDDRYRTVEEKNADKENDCNLKFKQYLIDQSLVDETWFESIEKKINSGFIKRLKKLRPHHTQIHLKHTYMSTKKEDVNMAKISYLEAIRQALDVALEKDAQTMILGEDVGKKVAFLG